MEEREGARGPAQPHVRLTPRQREDLGRRLAMAKGRDRRRLAAQLAEAYGVSKEWLRALRRRAERGETPNPVGRPRIGEDERARLRALAAAELARQGHTSGWRPILAAILRARAGRPGPERTSVMLVQQETGSLKAGARSRKRRAIEEARQGHEVLARDAVWSEDGTHLGRLAGGQESQGEVITDRATTATVSIRVGPPPSGIEIVAGLEQAKRERGGLPLVRQSDNGPAEVCDAVIVYAEKEQMILLRSRVHTPTDNPVAENRNGELKRESGLGKGVRLDSHADAAARIEAARRRLNEERLRGSRGWKTAAELDREMPRADTLVKRQEFYEECRAAMREAVLGLTDPDEARAAEQVAVWRTLERHGLSRPTAGRARMPCPRLSAHDRGAPASAEKGGATGPPEARSSLLGEIPRSLGRVAGGREGIEALEAGCTQDPRAAQGRTE